VLRAYLNDRSLGAVGGPREEANFNSETRGGSVPTTRKGRHSKEQEIFQNFYLD